MQQDSSFPYIFSQFLLALSKAQLANKQATARGLTCLVTAQRHPKPAKKMPDDFNGSMAEPLMTDAGLQRTRAARIDTTTTKNPDKMNAANYKKLVQFCNAIDFVGHAPQSTVVLCKCWSSTFQSMRRMVVTVVVAAADPSRSSRFIFLEQT